MLHLSQQFGKGALWQALNDIFLLIEVKRLLAHAQFANQLRFVILLLCPNGTFQDLFISFPSLLVFLAGLGSRFISLDYLLLFQIVIFFGLVLFVLIQGVIWAKD